MTGHQARLPIESAWPSRTRHSTVSGAVTPSPGISSDDFDFPRLPIVHMRAVWSSEAEAIRVREALNLIWFTSFVCPLLMSAVSITRSMNLYFVLTQEFVRDLDFLSA